MRRGCLVGFAALAACSRSCDRRDFEPAPVTAPTQVAPEAAPPSFAPARCAAASSVLTLPAEVVGEVATLGERVYIAAIRAGMSAVGVTSAGLEAPVWTPLGRAVGDAPPPEWIAGPGGRLFALAWERGDGGARWLVVWQVAPAVSRAFAVHDDEVAESMSADAAFGGDAGVLVWDSPRGVKVARLAADKVLAPVVLPATGMASGARVVANKGGGYWVIWSERRVDALPDGAPRSLEGEVVESPGERRGFEWLMVARLGATGELAAPARRITPENGHFGAFDVIVGAGGVPEVYALDELESVSGERGGRIHRIAVEPLPAVIDLLATGAGRGAPQVAVSSAGAQWVFFEDFLGRARALPLPSPASAMNLPSVEPALADARPSAPVAGSADLWFASSSSPPSLLKLRCVAPAR